MASTKKIGPCGGNGGEARDMNNLAEVTRILRIRVRHGNAINALMVRFLRNGQEDETDWWGGEGGNLTEFTLQATEYITSVKGRISRYKNNFIVRSLKFVTNLKSWGPYGREEGTPFELPAIGGQIIGFHGRSGIYLDALGVYYVETLTKKVGPCGGDGGLEKDMNIDGITRIVKISIRHDTNIINALTVHFLRNGSRESPEQWGGHGGNLTEFKLGASEYISSVKGHMSRNNDPCVVKSLEFETNLRSYGPYGKKEGIPFELQGTNCQIIGFHGRSEEFLHALGVYVKVNTLDDWLPRLRTNHGCFHTVTSGIRQFLKGIKINITTCISIRFHLG